MESPRPRPPGRDWKNYYLFGCTVRSNFPFQIELPPADGEPDLTLRIDPELPTGVAKQAAHLYSSEAVTEEGLPWARLYRLEEGHLIKIATVADFVIGKESLTCRPRTEDLRTVEAFLLQVAMSFWLETIGHPVLHASCIAAGDGAAAFLAFSGTGKSTLAAAFLTNGYRLISDDSLPLEITDRGVLAWPCHPRIKMEPEQARLFLEEISHLPPVNDLSDKIGVPVRETWSGSFGTSPEKLLSCYLPEHRTQQQDVIVEPVKGAEAVMELVRHSLVPRLAAGAGMQKRRFQLLTRVARQVQVCRLIYPSGLEALRDVREAVIGHLGSLS